MRMLPEPEEGRAWMQVDVTALELAVRNSCLPGEEAFAIFDAAGFALRSDQAFLTRRFGYRDALEPLQCALETESQNEAPATSCNAQDEST